MMEEWRMSRDAAGRLQEAHWKLILEVGAGLVHRGCAGCREGSAQPGRSAQRGRSMHSPGLRPGPGVDPARQLPAPASDACRRLPL